MIIEVSEEEGYDEMNTNDNNGDGCIDQELIETDRNNNGFRAQFMQNSRRFDYSMVRNY